MGLVQEIRLALRGLARTPGFAIVAVAVLALGIGANTAIFSVLRAILLRPLPFPDADALVVVGQSREKGRANTVSYADFVDWRRDSKSLAELAAWHDEQLTLDTGARPARIRGVATSANIFRTLRVQPALGRGFSDGEDELGKNRVVVLSHGAWQRYFGGAADILGRTITLDDAPFTVVGVLAPDFRFPLRDQDFEAWVPIPRPWDQAMIPRRGANYLSLVARLAPAASVTAAQADLDAQAARQAMAYPEESANRFVTVRGLQEEITAAVRPALLVLFGAVGFVLLIACANVANLLLARATARHREIAIRLAVGATRGRVVRQLLVESLVLALAGGGLGLMLALWGLDALVALIPPAVAGIRPIAVDGGVLAFTLAVAAVTGVVFGIVPALHAAAADPQDALREAGGRTTGGARRQRARSVLVATEIGVAAVLLVGAGLLIKSFARLSRVEPGFVVDDLVTSSVFLPDKRYPTPDKSLAFYHALVAKLDALPGAQAAAVGFPLPFSSMRLGLSYQLDGDPPAAPGHEPSASVHLVSPGYFATLGMTMRRGRGITAADDRADAAPVVVVNETLARKLGGDPVGKHLTTEWGKSASYEIVGVVGDVRGDGLDSPPPAAMYIPFGRTPFPFITFAVRSTVIADWSALLADSVQAIDAGLPVANTRTMAAAVHDSLARQRLSTMLLGIFGGLALCLALLGVYGVMSYIVSQREHEIGIRIALGARAGEVTWMIVGQALALAVAGVTVGLGGALAVARVLDRLLYGVDARDPIVFGAIGLFLIGIAGLAAYLPARRAARVDPMATLRTG